VKGKGWRIIKNKQGIDDLIRRFLEMLERTFQKDGGITSSMEKNKRRFKICTGNCYCKNFHPKFC